ncbi:MAG TPA: hypothetical protein VKH82_11650, partial [Candidatus Binatia bacterium]|nr:hypothetical protein [Candidatus Binatia bacterium]
TITLTASDPNGDTLTATWSIVTKPAGSTTASLTATGFTAHFTPDVAGDYTLKVMVADGVGGSASLSFPIHVSAAVCVRPDAPPPPIDAPPPPDAPPPINLNGTFVSHVTTTGTISVPLVNAQPANIDIVLRIFNSTSGGTVTSHLEFCRVNTATTDVSLVVNIPTSITALLVNDQTSPVQNLTVGGPVSLPSFNITVGQDAAGNSADTDHDGNPGVSIPTQLQGSNETMFSSLVIGLSFPSATLTDANTISGQLTVTTTGKVFGGTPLNLTGNLSVVTGTPTVAFTSTRLTGNVPCSQVLTMF